MMQKFPITSILHTVGHSYRRKVGLDVSCSSFHAIFHCCYTCGSRPTHIYKSFQCAGMLEFGVVRQYFITVNTVCE